MGQGTAHGSYGGADKDHPGNLGTRSPLQAHATPSSKGPRSPNWAGPSGTPRGAGCHPDTQQRPPHNTPLVLLLLSYPRYPPHPELAEGGAPRRGDAGCPASPSAPSAGTREVQCCHPAAASGNRSSGKKGGGAPSRDGAPPPPHYHPPPPTPRGSSSDSLIRFLREPARGVNPQAKRGFALKSL